MGSPLFRLCSLQTYKLIQNKRGVKHTLSVLAHGKIQKPRKVFDFCLCIFSFLHSPAAYHIPTLCPWDSEYSIGQLTTNENSLIFSLELRAKKSRDGPCLQTCSCCRFRPVVPQREGRSRLCAMGLQPSSLCSEVVDSCFGICLVVDIMVCLRCSVINS